jgi:phosphoglycolate phosphatase-like HAD superfamily hydrolase
MTSRGAWAGRFPARRAKAIGIGLLSGDYDVSELERAGALRVYNDPLDLLRHLDEVATFQ